VSLLLLYAMGRVSSPHGGEIVLLLYVKEADSFSVQKRVSSLGRVESAPLLYVEGRVSLFYTRSRETLLVAKESVSLSSRQRG